MVLAIELALVAALIFWAFSSWSRGRRDARRETRELRRVDAYIETLRRERPHPALAAMGDAELREVLHGLMRGLHLARETRKSVVLIGAALTIAAAGVLGWAFGPLWSATGLALGALVVLGLYVVLDRRARAPIARYGLDIERLRVD